MYSKKFLKLGPKPTASKLGPLEDDDIDIDIDIDIDDDYTETITKKMSINNSSSISKKIYERKKIPMETVVKKSIPKSQSLKQSKASLRFCLYSIF